MSIIHLLGSVQPAASGFEKYAGGLAVPGVDGNGKEGLVSAGAGLIMEPHGRGHGSGVVGITHQNCGTVGHLEQFIAFTKCVLKDAIQGLL